MDSDYITRIIIQAIDQASPIIAGVGKTSDGAALSVSELDARLAGLAATTGSIDDALTSMVEKQQVLSAGIRDTTSSASAETVVFRENALAAAQSAAATGTMAASLSRELRSSLDQAAQENLKYGAVTEATNTRVRSAIVTHDAYGASLDRVNAAYGRTEQTVAGSATTWANATSKLKIFELGLGGVIGVSTDMAMKFQQNMELIHTQAGAPQAEVDSLSGSILALSNTVAFGPNSLAESLYHAESAGFRSAAALDIVKASADGARVGNANLEATTQAVIAVMSSQISGVKNAGDAMATLNAIVGTGDMKMQGLVESLSTGILPTFKVAGLSIRDFGAGIATLTDNVTPPIEAATRLRMTVALLAAPSGAAAKALEAVGLSATEANAALKDRTYLEQYGIHLSQLSADLRQPNGLLVALEDLKSHLEASGLTATEQAAVITRAFGGGRSSGAIQTLLDEIDRLKSKYGAIDQTVTQFGEDVSKTHQTMAFQLQQAKASSEALSISLGQGLAPAETAVLNALTPVLQGMASFTKQHQDVTAAVLLAAGGIGVLALSISTATTIWNFASISAQKLGVSAATSTPSVAGLGVATGAAGVAAADATPLFTLLDDSIVGLGTVAQTTSGLLIPAEAAITAAGAQSAIAAPEVGTMGAAMATAGAEGAAAAPGIGLFSGALKGLAAAAATGVALPALALVLGAAWDNQNRLAAQANATLTEHDRILRDVANGATLTTATSLEHARSLKQVADASDAASMNMSLYDRFLVTQIPHLEQLAQSEKKHRDELDAKTVSYGKLMAAMGGIDVHGILMAGPQPPTSAGGGSGAGSGVGTIDLQKSIQSLTKEVQDAANTVAYDREHNHAALATDTGILEDRRQKLIALQNEESNLTSTTAKTSSSIHDLGLKTDEWSKRYAADQDRVTAAQHQVELDLVNHSSKLQGDESWLGRVTASLGQMDGAVQRVTQMAADAEYRKYGAPQQAVSSSIASLQNQSALVGQNTSLSSQDKATSQGQLQVLIDLKTIALDHLKLDQLRKEHAPQSQIAAAQATLTGDTYKLGQDRLTVTADISAGDLARLESHFQVLESADTSKIAQLQHQSAMIGLNTQLTSEQKAVLQAGLQVQIDLKQIALDTLKLQAVLADPHHTAADVASARGQLDSDANKLQEDQASLRNAKATDEATKAIQKWTLETSQHSQKSEEALDALALGIRNHDTPAQLEKLALAAASAQSLVNGDGTAHQKAADMVTKLLDPGIKLAGVFKQIADSGQSAADYLTKTFGRQGMDHSFGYGAFSATGGQLVNAGTTTKIDNANLQITGLETTNSLLQQQITAINNDTSLTAEQKAVQVATLQLQIDHNKLVEDNWKLLIATLQKDPGAIASAQGQIKIDTAQQGNDQTVYSTAVKNLTDLSSVTADLTTYFLTGKGNFEQLVAAGKADIAADTAKANAAWLATYALAGMSDKLTMLAQKFQPLISQQSSQQSAQSGVDNANLQVISANSAIQVGLLTAEVTATQDLAGLATANAGVDTARFNLQLARINDGTAVMQAIASNDATLLATQRTISQDQASGNTVKEALDRQLLAVQQKSGADAIAIAKATAQMDQAVGMAQLAVARDQAKEAADKILVDQRNADAAGKLALDALAVANDGVDVARASQAIQSLMAGNQGTTNDLLNQIISTLGGDTSGNDPTIAAYGQKLAGLLDTLSGAQGQLSVDQKQQTIDQGSANVLSAQGSLLLAGDQSQTSGDQTLETKVQQMWELSIAQLKAQQAGDQVQEQKIQAELSNINSSVQTVNQTLQQTKSLLNDLKGLSRQGLDRINVSTHTTEQILDGVAHQVAGTVSAG